MAVTLRVDPKTPPMTWGEFCQRKPPFSVGLDGYILGKPEFDSRGPWANFNHHEDVDRLGTRSTSGQVLVAIRQGLFLSFQKDNEPHIFPHVNDCDQDVCTATTLLKNSETILATPNPRLNRLVNLVDILDTTSGLCALPVHTSVLEQHAWVFDPYIQFRYGGQIDKRDSKEFEDIIKEVEIRILEHIAGNESSIPLDCRYEMLGGGMQWKMIREIGTHARSAIFKEGFRAIVTVRKRKDEKYNYTFCKASPFIPFNITLIIATLNKLEGLKGLPDCHGGCDMTGGTSRNTGCAIPPKELERIINALHT